MTQYPGYFSACNDTKWDELRKLALSLPPEKRPRFRSKHLETGHLSNWDTEWFYHFRDGGYADIEYVELDFAGTTLDDVAERLTGIGFAGRQDEDVVRVYGYLLHGTEAPRLAINTG